ncbi:hypothetical protein [Lysinibacillus piscis]|uniref:2-keto-3-deoxygluconate kinase n=1 Tax=Lysinibacillus piscis TaxID=2518931 RepID=A0ABQ5NMM5_9BACI|nr:hypothetical protein [Lysinibacillus sp. KH24]GLC89621.1 hypothetical protein LYSBPC_27480 [Lysinibacillus sp. KH24]
MRNEHFSREGHHHRGNRMERGDLHRGGHRRGGRGDAQQGPKTFRRGRAISFLEQLMLKRSTIVQQLEQPEFQSIQQILIGELKALDMVINEFTQLFELHLEEIQTEDMTEEENKHDEGN